MHFAGKKCRCFSKHTAVVEPSMNRITWPRATTACSLFLATHVCRPAAAWVETHTCMHGPHLGVRASEACTAAMRLGVLGAAWLLAAASLLLLPGFIFKALPCVPRYAAHHQHSRACIEASGPCLEGWQGLKRHKDLSSQVRPFSSSIQHALDSLNPSQDKMSCS